MASLKEQVPPDLLPPSTPGPAKAPPYVTGNVGADRAIAPVTQNLPDGAMKAVQNPSPYAEQVRAGLAKAAPYLPGAALVTPQGQRLVGAVTAPFTGAPIIKPGVDAAMGVLGIKPAQAEGAADTHVERDGSADIAQRPLSEQQMDRVDTNVQNAAANQAEADRVKAAMMPHMVGAAEVAKVDPKRQAALDNEFKREQDSIDDQGAKASDIGDAKANLELAKAAGQMQVSQAQEEAGHKTAARADSRLAKAEELQAKIDALSNKVYTENKEDPNRWWHNQTTGDRAKWAIGAAISGATGDGKNHVLDTMKNLARSDIEAQRQQYQHGRDRIGDAKSLYGMAMEATGNHDQAMQLAEKWHVQGMLSQADAMAASSGSQVELANAAMLRSKLGQENAQVGQKRVEAGIKNNTWVPAHMVTPAGAAGAGGATDWGAQEKVAKERHAAGLDAQEARMSRLDTLTKANGGQIPGTDMKSRGLWMLARQTDEHGQPTSVARIAMSQLSPEAIEADGILTGVGEGLAKASGQRGTEAIHLNKGIVTGNGSHESITRGINHARSVFRSEEKNINGARPVQQALIGGINRTVAPVSNPFRQQAPQQAEDDESPDGFTPLKK